MGAETQILVVDSGSDTCKAGVSGESAPRVEYHTIVHPKRNNIKSTVIDFTVEGISHTNDELRNYLNPIENGIITNFDVMEKIWSYTFFNMLNKNPEEHPVIITESPFNPKEKREKTTTIIFETFNIPSYYTANTSALSLFASGLTTGVVLDIGDSTSQTVPVYEGHSIKHAMNELEFGGRDLTQWMMTLLKKQWYSFYTPAEIASIYEMKETLCYVAEDFEKELSKSSTVSFKMPYGDIVDLKEERFLCPEVLFQPSICGSESMSVDEALVSSISACDEELVQTMMNNVIIAGGSTMFKGFQKRLERELAEYGTFSGVKVTAPEERKYSAWVGGSIVGCLSSFPQMAVTKAEYDEIGPNIVNLKCF